MGRAVLLMNESDAWTYLAEAWTAAHRARRRSAAGPEGLLWRGLCGGVTFLYRQGWIAPFTYREMDDKVWEQVRLAKRRDGLAWPPTVDGARQRAAFCRRMARRTARRAKQEGNEKGGEAHGHAE
jgi:hypothetical protein